MPYNQRVNIGADELAALGFRTQKGGSKEYMPLHAYRDKHIPAEGLWQHYYRCPKCEWERRKISVCRYCDIPMTEIGGLPFVRTVEGVEVRRVDLPPPKDAKEVRKDEQTGIRIFKVDL